MGKTPKLMLNADGPVEITLYDYLLRPMHTAQRHSTTSDTPLEFPTLNNAANGIYFIHIRRQSESLRLKMIKN